MGTAIQEAPSFDDVDDFLLAQELAHERPASVHVPFGVLDGMLTPLPKIDMSRANGSVYLTPTNNKDRQTDSDRENW
jgi:hypothetical protein